MKKLISIKLIFLLVFFFTPLNSYSQNINAKGASVKAKTVAAKSKLSTFFGTWSATKIWAVAVLGSAVVIGGAAGGGGGGGDGGDGGGEDNDDDVNKTKISFAQELANQYGVGAINADKAHFEGFTGKNVIVAVIDSGVDLGHYDLSANILGNGHDFGESDSNPDSDGIDSHGTHVAGIIAATRNEYGMYGVAYDAKILPIKISDNSGDLTGSTGDAMTYAVNNGAKVINNSWGIPTVSIGDFDITPYDDNEDGYLDIKDFQTEDDLIGALDSNFINAAKNAANNGVITVFAAGNDGSPQTSIHSALPVIISELKGHWVAVVAVDSNNDIADFSNHCGLSYEWCIAAPGVDILSTIDPRDDSVDANNDGFEYFNGTSMAAPHVSGALAVLIEASPHLTSEQLLDLLFTTATDLGDTETYGHGLVNLEAAMQPQGSSFLSLGSSVSGSAIALNSSKISNGIFANAFTNKNIEVAFLDKYKRTYSVNLSNFAVADQSKNFYNLFADFNKRYQKTILPISKNSSFTFLRDVKQNFNKNSDPRDLSAFNFSSKITDSSEFALNYNISMRQSFSSGVVNENNKEILQLTQESASSNPFLNFAENGFNSIFTIDDKNSQIKLVSFFADLKDEYFDESGKLNEINAKRKVNGFASEYTQNLKNTSFALQLGLINEEGSFLGAINEGAFSLEDKVTTYFANFATKFDLGEKTTLYGNYNYGISLPQTIQNSLISDISKIATSSFGISLVRNDFIKANNDFGLAISQPLRIENGSANLDLPIGRTMSGEMVRQNMLLNLSPTAREIDFESFYKFSLDKSSDLKGKFLYRTSPNHDKNAKDEAIFFLNYSMNF